MMVHPHYLKSKSKNCCCDFKFFSIAIGKADFSLILKDGNYLEMRFRLNLADDYKDHTAF